MTQLEPCPHCRRHVRLDETACPFCAQPLAFAPRAPRILPRRPIHRAALFAFSVLATQACGSDEAPPPDARTGSVDAAGSVDGAVDGSVDADDNPDGGIAIYSSAPTLPTDPDPDPNASSNG